MASRPVLVACAMVALPGIVTSTPTPPEPTKPGGRAAARMLPLLPPPKLDFERIDGARWAVAGPVGAGLLLPNTLAW